MHQIPFNAIFQIYGFNFIKISLTYLHFYPKEVFGYIFNKWSHLETQILIWNHIPSDDNIWLNFYLTNDWGKQLLDNMNLKKSVLEVYLEVKFINFSDFTKEYNKLGNYNPQHLSSNLWAPELFSILFPTVVNSQCKLSENM